MSALARDLGVTCTSLGEWVRRAEIEEGVRNGITRDEREELARFKRENRILKEEREILRKAAAFFAQETKAQLRRRGWPQEALNLDVTNRAM